MKETKRTERVAEGIPEKFGLEDSEAGREESFSEWVTDRCGGRDLGNESKERWSKTYGMPIIVRRSFVQNPVTGAHSSSLIAMKVGI